MAEKKNALANTDEKTDFFGVRNSGADGDIPLRSLAVFERPVPQMAGNIIVM
jgi:hypothetical protein